MSASDGAFCETADSERVRRVRPAVQVPRKPEVVVSGQLALVIDEASVAPAAVWETLPAQRQLQVAVRLARLLARLLEAARDE